MVRRGMRLDGPTTHAPDCDCTPFDRSALALSRSHPIEAEISTHTPAALDQYDAYASNCANDPVFQRCKDQVLNRTPDEDESAQFEARLQDRWHTIVGGGPVIISYSTVIPISEACRNERFVGDWCADSPQVSLDRERQLRMGTVAGVSADGRYLTFIVTTAHLPNKLSQLVLTQGASTGIRFDGSESSQIWYAGEELTANTRRISNALLVYARRIPPAAPPDGAAAIDDSHTAFQPRGTDSLWHHGSGGYAGHFWWTLNNQSRLDNTARWSVDVGESGDYEILVYIPPQHATTTSAPYEVHHDGQMDPITINQREHCNQWVSLGEYSFSGAGDEFVFLGDATGEKPSTEEIAFDAVAYVFQPPSPWDRILHLIEKWLDTVQERIEREIEQWWENWKRQQAERLERWFEEEFTRWAEQQCPGTQLSMLLGLAAAAIAWQRERRL